MLRLALILALLPTLALADTTGPARVIDGDTIEIGSESIRLHGIDAPEAAQQCQDQAGKPYKCGPRATRVLRRLTDGETVRCEERDRDRYGRIVTVCYVGSQDLNRQMVLKGGNAST